MFKLHVSLRNALFAASIMAALVSGAVSQAQETTFVKDWLFQVETEELPKSFSYKGATVSPVAKVVVTAALVTEKDNKKPYESLWYHDGKPIGMERQAKLPIPKSDRAAMEITHKKNPATPEELKAVANVILRMKLDAYHNDNPIIYIKVPADSFQEICTEMKNIGCSEQPRGQNGSYQYKMAFFLESNPRGQSQHLFFN